MDFVLELFEEGKALFQNDIILAPCFNSGWAKLAKYYSKTSESPAYAAALVLHPAYKWEYIHSIWEESWIPSAKEAVEELWKTKYQPADSSLLLLPASTSRRKVTTNEFTQWKRQKQATRPSILLGDEYARYIRVPPHNDFGDVREWWLRPEQQRDYPNRSKMALDILSIPAMSASPERLFSSSKLTISDRRCRLDIDTIQAIECLKSWRKLKDFDL